MWAGTMPAKIPPLAKRARFEVLHVGYGEDRVASTVSYVEEGTFRAIIDPGMVPTREAILRPLAGQGVRPEDVTDVILSHHHPDHTVNCALFPRARVHDYWAVYLGDRWTSRPAEKLLLAPSVMLLETPGHTPQDITTLVGTPKGVVAFTHLWWNSGGPTPDPLASDNGLIRTHRRRVLQLARTIVPGHGAPFVPDPRRREAPPGSPSRGRSTA
jgi:glyoxylase-like metal-dependent hydrolase (beta-lactamase superfamily II)